MLIPRTWNMRLWKPGGAASESPDLAFARTRDAIVVGAFPPGAVLDPFALSLKWGFSRTAMREALVRLRAAGLVVTGPDSVPVVSDVDLTAALDAQVVILEMHRLAVELATPRFTHSDIRQMRLENQRFAAAVDSGDVDEILAADDAFHDVAVQACANHTVVAVLEQFTPLVRRLERRRFSSTAARESIRLHDQLTDLCESGDVIGAAGIVVEIWSTLAFLDETPPKR